MNNPAKTKCREVGQGPESFQFIVKAYQGMTGHLRGYIPFENKKDMIQAFKESLEPYIEKNKLAMVLFQFPPWFDLKRENVDYLRWRWVSYRVPWGSGINRGLFRSTTSKPSILCERRSGFTAFFGAAIWGGIRSDRIGVNPS